MVRLVERFNLWYQDYPKIESLDRGAQQVSEFLTELMAISRIRLRLVREHPETGHEELDLSALCLLPVEGLCEAHIIEEWLLSGAALVADASDLIVRQPPKPEIVP